MSATGKCPGCHGTVINKPIMIDGKERTHGVCAACGLEPIVYIRAQQPELRDQMAMAVLAAMLSREPGFPEGWSKTAYGFADAMLLEREEKPFVGIDPAHKFNPAHIGFDLPGGGRVTGTVVKEDGTHYWLDISNDIIKWAKEGDNAEARKQAEAAR